MIIPAAGTQGMRHWTRLARTVTLPAGTGAAWGVEGGAGQSSSAPSLRSSSAHGWPFQKALVRKYFSFRKSFILFDAGLLRGAWQRSQNQACFFKCPHEFSHAGIFFLARSARACADGVSRTLGYVASSTFHCVYGTRFAPNIRWYTKRRVHGPYHVRGCVLDGRRVTGMISCMVHFCRRLTGMAGVTPGEETSSSTGFLLSIILQVCSMFYRMPAKSPCPSSRNLFLNGPLVHYFLMEPVQNAPVQRASKNI